MSIVEAIGGPAFAQTAKAVRPLGYTDEQWRAALADANRLGYSAGIPT